MTDDAETEIKYRLDELQTLRNLRGRLKKLQEDLREVSASKTLLLKQQQYQQVNGEIKRLEKEISGKTGYRGQQQGELLKAEENLHQTVLTQRGFLQTLKELENCPGSDKAQWDDKFDKIYGSRDDRELREIYAQTRKGNLTKKEGLLQEMVLAMMEYKSAFEMGAEASMDGYGEFEKLYHHLKDSQLLSYESKVAEAKESAEIEFREQFLSKLQENIVQARTEFSRLNKSLETIPFGGDYYKFEYFGSRRYREYYDMIMDDFNVIEGISLLSGQFHERHRKVIDELFEKLTCDEDSAKVLDEFTDYRTYMDYDIRIDHGQGSYSYYSKVCEEKSGGETQTPFYVTVAASFMQLYSSAIGGDSIGLILLDEAFNNMDDERISGVLEFFKKLPLQIIVAAPPDKIQYIQPSINHTLLVLKEGGSSYVEKFDYEKAQ